jgi:hypothetical protein
MWELLFTYTSDATNAVLPPLDESMQSICKLYYLVLACFFYDAAATVDPETHTRFPCTGKPILFTVEHDKKNYCTLPFTKEPL